MTIIHMYIISSWRDHLQEPEDGMGGGVGWGIGGRGGWYRSSLGVPQKYNNGNIQNIWGGRG